MHKVWIRALKIEDANISYKWRNNPEIWQYTGNRPSISITEEIEKNWLAEKLTEDTSFRFAIIVDDIYVGNVQITNIIDGDKGQYHIFIGDKSFWGKGIAKLATAQIIRFAKEKLNLKELYLIVNPLNKAAINLYIKSGFNKVDDQILMSLNLVNSKPPIVSVYLMSYNHEQFISKALEGILMQKTDFDYDIIIGDDFSQDNTRKIIQEYADKYPGKFILLLHEKNIGAMANQISILKACTGKYIALCEGDDYWTDPYKLQKQIDFLDQNTEYVMHCHNATVIYEDNILDQHLFNDNQQEATLEFSDLIKEWNIPTASMLFKNSALAIIPQWFPEIYNGDYVLGLLIASKGKIKYSEDVMSVYRKNFGALSYNPKINAEFNTSKLIVLFKYLNKETDYEYDNIIQKRIVALQIKYSLLKRKRKYPFLYPAYFLKIILSRIGIAVYKNKNNRRFDFRIINLLKHQGKRV